MITKVLSFAPQQGEVCHFPLWFEKKSAREREEVLACKWRGRGARTREKTGDWGIGTRDPSHQTSIFLPLSRFLYACYAG